jgi:hypothetical protein
VLDICCVLIFVIIGRASHTKGETLAGIASTAWPFLAGLGIGWLACRSWRRVGARPIAKPRSYRARGPPPTQPRLLGGPPPHASTTQGDDPRTPDPGGLVPAGVGAWLCTVAFGMVLRVVSGQGTALSFIIVALAFLGLFLLGWRLLWRLFARLAALAA